jgi:uncharacterized protein YvpB
MTKILEVPYYSQLGKGAEYYVNDCLAACMRMVWGYYRLKLGKDNPETVTVNEFSRLILDSTYDLGSILDVYKLPYPRAIPYKPVSKDSGTTIDRIQESIKQDWPVICLGVRGYIPNRPLPQSTGGHFVVVVGYDHDSIYIHDPYSMDDTGKNFKVNQLDFIKFLTNGRWQDRTYFSNVYQGLIHQSID